MSTDAAPFDLARLARSFAERSTQPMAVVEGPAHVVRYFNPAFARLAGKTADELLGRPFAEALPGRPGVGCLEALDRVLRTGNPEGLAEQEHRQTPPVYRSYEMWSVLGENDLPAGVMVRVTDATDVAVFRLRASAMNEALLVSSVQQHELIETIQRGEQKRRDLEAKIFRAQKLESLGVLAGGIAHDLNNMLTPVLGYADLVAVSLPAGAPAHPMLEEITEGARRAADLVQQILAFAGKGRFVIQPIELSDLVREMGGLLASAVSVNARLRYDLAPALPAVEADATQLRQVVLNLVKNASEALGPGGGTITVRTGQGPSDDRAPLPARPEEGPPSGPSVFLEVADTGCGMAADVVEKIFDPFFTTKFTGRGLGLAVVQGVARGHRGTLQVRSEPGIGSTLRLYLPCTAEPAAAPAAPGRPVAWRGSGTVLLIDDERTVRDIAARILVGAGLTVLHAGDGEEGLSLYRNHDRTIDAVILDMTMPKMGGLEVAETLRSLGSEVPIVLMSGFSVVEVTLKAASLGIAGYVQKPFSAADLLVAVRLALRQ